MDGEPQLKWKSSLRYQEAELHTFDVIVDCKIIGEVGQQVETGLRYSCAVQGETEEPIVRWFLRHPTNQWGDLDSQDAALRDLLRVELLAQAAARKGRSNR